MNEKILQQYHGQCGLMFNLVFRQQTKTLRQGGGIDKPYPAALSFTTPYPLLCAFAVPAAKYCKHSCGFARLL